MSYIYIYIYNICIAQLDFVAKYNNNSVVKGILYVRKKKYKSLNYFSTNFKYQSYEDDIPRRNGTGPVPNNW